MMTDCGSGKRRSGAIVFVTILLCAAAIRVFALAASDNFHGIAAGKIIAAQILLEHPNSAYSWVVPAHGPVHLYLLAAAIKLFSHPVLTARLLSLGMGILFFIPYFGSIRRIFDDDVAVLSVFVAAFFPLHVLYSALSTAETAFLFFLFLGIWLYLRGSMDSDFRALALGGAALGAAALCRFEGALSIVVLAAFLLRRRKELLVFCAAAAVLPLLWAGANYVLFGHPLFFLKASDAVVQTEYNRLRLLGIPVTFTGKAFFWPRELYHYFGFPVVIAGVSGVWLLGRKKEFRIFFVLLAVTLGFFALKTVREELAMQPRYGISIGLFFLPFCAAQLISWLRKMKKPYFKTVFFGFCMLTIFRGAYLTYLELPRTPAWVENTAGFLRENVREGEAVFIETEEDNYREPIKLLSGLPVGTFIDFEGFFTHQEYIDPLKRHKLRYIVMVSGRQLSGYNEVFREEQCKIYDLR